MKPEPFYDDIGDNEIRVITSKSSILSSIKKSKLLWIFIGLAVVALITTFIIYNHWNADTEGPEELEFSPSTTIAEETSSESSIADAPTAINKHGYVEINDTIINGIPLSIFHPVNVTPRLHIGADILEDSTVVFVTQAADVRRDNKQILGAFVIDGELVSRGESKSGFCAIINGKPIVGVADATPYLEQAIETDGYFFRQYPLVVGGQVVDNKLKPSSLRKALAELNGEIVVVMSKNRITLNEFAKSLVDLGVSNAIYLVGSSAYGFAKESTGELIEFGTKTDNNYDLYTNINYIVWE